MTLLVAILVVVLLVQACIFIYSRKMKKQMRENDVLLKYNINTRSELFSSLANPDIPESDREKLQKIYNTEEE